MTLPTRSQLTDVLEGRATYALVEAEALDTLRSIPTGVVGAVITDPPYSSGGFTRGDRSGNPKTKYGKAGTAKHLPGFSGDNRDQRSFAHWCALWLSEALRASESGAVLVQFSDWRQLPVTTDAVQAGGWVWRGLGVWAKPVARPQLGRFTASSEFWVWGTNGQAPSMRELGCIKGYIEAPFPTGPSRLHLTMKPDAVMDHVLRIVPPGAIVLDPFAGSGSTGAAALRRGLRFIGVERDPGYAEVARKRLELAANDARTRTRNGAEGST